MRSLRQPIAEAEQVVEAPSIKIEKKEPTSTARFLSSLFATTTAVTLSSPLDVLKTRLQVQNCKTTGDVLFQNLTQSFKRIYMKEGVKGFFRGYKTTIVTTPLFHSIYFPCYEKLRLTIASQYGLNKTDMKVVGVSSAISGILCNIITNPLWLVRTRMQAEIFRVSSQAHYSRKYKSVLGSIYKIYSREGFLALYTGLGASFLGISHVCIYFPLYEKMKIIFKTILGVEQQYTQKNKSWAISPSVAIL
jgi:solute carrier family 25 (mitochondrial folate transporter), member 32